MTSLKDSNNQEVFMDQEMALALINSTRESLANAVFRITELEAALKIEKSKNESLLSELNKTLASDK
jgi:hypothetical protein